MSETIRTHVGAFEVVSDINAEQELAVIARPCAAHQTVVLQVLEGTVNDRDNHVSVFLTHAAAAKLIGQLAAAMGATMEEKGDDDDV